MSALEELLAAVERGPGEWLSLPALAALPANEPLQTTVYCNALEWFTADRAKNSRDTAIAGQALAEALDGTCCDNPTCFCDEAALAQWENLCGTKEGRGGSD